MKHGTDHLDGSSWVAARIALSGVPVKVLWSTRFCYVVTVVETGESGRSERASLVPTVVGSQSLPLVAEAGRAALVCRALIGL